MSSFERERVIRFSDCDPAGIVFYPQYFVMFNGLVEDWFNEELEVGYRKLLIERKVGLPTVRLEADFRAVSQMGDRVKLSLSIERLGVRSLTFNLRCTGANNELRMSVRQVIVTTSLNGHHAIEIPTDFRIALMRFDEKTLESL